MKKEYEPLICLKRPRDRDIPDAMKNSDHQVHWLFSEHYQNNVLNTLHKWLRLQMKIRENSRIQVMRRGNVEFNPDYIQLVAATVLTCDNQMILLKCKKGDMQGKLTLVQGHCEYSPFYADRPLSYIIKAEALRELHEELNFKKDRFLIRKFYRGIEAFSFNFHNKEEISYYHLGIIHNIEIPSHFKQYLSDPDYLCSGEEDKNDIHILNLDDDISIYKPDSWLEEIFAHYQEKYKMGLL